MKPTPAPKEEIVPTENEILDDDFETEFELEFEPDFELEEE